MLINGASGGVGTFAVQIAKAMGAEVTGVCSTRNVDLVKSLGADHVVDYKSTDYTAGDQAYDLIVDNIGNRSVRDNRKVLAPQGVYVIVGAPSDDPWIGALVGPIRAKAYAPFVDQQLKFFVASMNPRTSVICRAHAGRQARFRRSIAAIHSPRPRRPSLSRDGPRARQGGHRHSMNRQAPRSAFSRLHDAQRLDRAVLVTSSRAVWLLGGSATSLVPSGVTRSPQRTT